MIEGLSERWQSMSGGSKTGFFVALALIVAILIGGSVWLLRDDYQVLFTDLSPQDAAAMVSELERMKMPYVLADDGTTVLVEAAEVYRTRLKLMGSGIDLHGAVGFEIFNEADFGMTDFAQKVNYQRAMQGELVRTISTLDEVKTARVHLVLPESGLFKKKGEIAKASISLTTERGRDLTPAQISGIQRLVAAAVPQIAPASVTILDQRGVALTRPMEADPVNAAPVGRLDVKKQVEAYITRKIVDVLDRAVGPGQAIVSVDATLDYNQTKITTEDIVPLPNTSGQSVGAIARRRDSVQGDPVSAVVKAAAGVPGGQSASRNTELEFVNGRRVKQMVSAPGSLQRLTIGIMIPGEDDPVALEKIKEVVAMAAGLEESRGDVIAVYSVDVPKAKVENATASGGVEQLELDEQPVAQVVDRDDGRVTGAVLAFLEQQPLALLGGLLLVILLLWLMASRRERFATTLSEEERSRLLEELSQWAANAKTTTSAERA